MPSSAPPPLAVPPPPAPPTVTLGTLLGATWIAWNRCKLPLALLGALLGGTLVAVVRLGVHRLPLLPRVDDVLSLSLLFLAFALQAGAVARGVHDAARGRPARLPAMLAAAARRLVHVAVVALVLLAGLAAAALLLRAGLLRAMGGGHEAAEDASGWSALVMYVVAAYPAGAWAAVVPGVVNERLGPLAAVRMSGALTRGRRLELALATLAVLTGWLLGVAAVEAVLMNLAPGWVGGTMGAVALFAVPLPLVLPAVAHDALRAERRGLPAEDLERIFE